MGKKSDPSVISIDPRQLKLRSLRKSGTESQPEPNDKLKFDASKFAKMVEHAFKGDLERRSVPLHESGVEGPEQMTVAQRITEHEESIGGKQQDIFKRWNDLAQNADSAFGNTAVTAGQRYNALSRVFSKEMHKELSNVRDEQVKFYQNLLKEEKALDKPNPDNIKELKGRIDLIKEEHAERLAELQKQFVTMRDEFMQDFTPKQKDLAENQRLETVAKAGKWLKKSDVGLQLLNAPRETMQQENGATVKFKDSKGATSKFTLTCDDKGKVSINMRIPKKMNEAQTQEFAGKFVELSSATLKKDKPLTFQSSNAKLNFEVYKQARQAGFKDVQVSMSAKSSLAEQQGLQKQIAEFEKDPNNLKPKPDKSVKFDDSGKAPKGESYSTEQYKSMREAFQKGHESAVTKHEASQPKNGPEVEVSQLPSNGPG
jgi:hypothetical protein